MSRSASVDDEKTIATTGWRDRVTPSTLWPRLQIWLTGRKHSTIGFSVLRVLFGVAMLIVLVPSYADRHYLWGAGAWWVDPEANRRGWWEPLRMLFPKDNAVVFDLSFHVLLALAILFVVGFQTRWVTPSCSCSGWGSRPTARCSATAETRSCGSCSSSSSSPT